MSPQTGRVAHALVVDRKLLPKRPFPAGFCDERALKQSTAVRALAVAESGVIISTKDAPPRTRFRTYM